MLLLKRAELQERLADDQERLGRIEARLVRMEKVDIMLPDIVVKDLPPIRAAAVAGTTAVPGFDDLRPSLAPAYAHLRSTLEQAGVRHSGPLFNFYEEQPDGTLLPFAAVDV